MALPTTRFQVSMAQAGSVPLGGVKWKALFDNDNTLTNKILFCNTHTSELMSWMGFKRNKDYVFTCIPYTDEQRESVINAVEEQVSKLLTQHEWSRNFQLVPTNKIYPKAEGCVFYEKREDGLLYGVNPDIEGELHNTPEKCLSVGALLHINGVYFDFATYKAKLTFKLVSATYSWTKTPAAREEILMSYLSAFGPIATASPQQHQEEQSKSADIVEAAVAASGITTTPGEETTSVFDKEAFLASLSKMRSVGGVQRKMRQLRKQQIRDDVIEWCEREARHVMFALSKKEPAKKRSNAIAEDSAAAAVVPSKKMKTFALQPREGDNNDNSLYKALGMDDSLGAIVSSDDDNDDEDVEDDETEENCGVY